MLRPVPPGLPPPDAREARMPDGALPTISVVVDTEEAFDWSAPFDRRNTDVSHMAEIGRLQEVFAHHGIVPAYVATYPVIDQPVGYSALRALVEAGAAEIGAHLHPWVTPPFEEDVTAFNSYPGNLPPALEREKLRRLVARITETIGVAPFLYKAGRYGKGPNTYGILADEGFSIDVSPMPPMDFRADGGPDFRRHTAAPFWFGPEAGLLCLPNSGGFVGPLAALGPVLHEQFSGLLGRTLKAQGIASRLRLMERIRLSPEGFSADDMVRLAKAMIARGERCLVLTLHSPSVVPGNTPYVRDASELRAFLGRLDETLGRLIGNGAEPLSLSALRSRLLKAH